MWTDRFNPDEGVIWVAVHLFGPADDRWFRFVLDTGTPMTTIDTGIMDSLGYGAHMATRRSRAVGVGGAESGFLLPISRIDTMGSSVSGLEVSCTELPTWMGVDGLVGMDLLRGHVLVLDCTQGVLRID
jgi:Aspartyl protease